MRGNADDSLFVKVDYRYVRISQSDIRFIKGFGEYIRIYIDGREDPLVTLSSFSAVMERLGDSFLQVHRSFIVNMNKIEQIERNRLVMDADNIIPVGDSYKNMLNDYLAAHAVGRSPK
ncbi:MAG: LytTR family transcriptional regulator, partial [Muribaculaceae bacterium]|nr:LytTR family transcriptional regulator [Muribaculaceae bacterium]